MKLSLIIPANNEEAFLPACLDALVQQELSASSRGEIEIIIAANACHDRTVEIGEEYRQKAEQKGFGYRVLDIKEGGKLNALNRADEIANGPMRAYLDADVILAPDMLDQIIAVLEGEGPLYASGTLVVAPAKSFISRHYARLWSNLPFMTGGVQGAGFFAVNEAGRALWSRFPDIIADDAYVRLLFTPDQRVKVRASYLWPVIEGAQNLIRVRARQNRGLLEVYEKFPELEKNEDKAPLTPGLLARLILGMPISFVIYCAILLGARRAARSGSNQWTRGR